MILIIKDPTTLQTHHYINLYQYSKADINTHKVTQRYILGVKGKIFKDHFTANLLPGTTVFRGTWNFEPSRGNCPFPQNFYIFVKIFLRNLVLAGDKSTNMPYFGGFQAAIDN